MKIGHHAEKPAPAPSTGSAAGAVGGQASAAPASAIPETADPSAKIQLSSTASTLLASGATPEFDAAKVDRISKSIANGSFSINPGAIADKLISNAHEVLAKVSS
ncbi:MAG TPA: flagellar biosynthesis anti-sigma factor FlgM [Burkholderiaceae bacterium]|jgi:negative regulator of flagellin synthesis FlgM